MKNADLKIKSKIKLIEERLPVLSSYLEDCRLCPRYCGVNRKKGEKGYCRSTDDILVYTYGPHHGEEPSISGTRGSGTIFFSNCNMKCVYCQNFHFSQLSEGEVFSVQGLGEAMLSLQDAGCHNINLVNPTHFVPQITSALRSAFYAGLRLPVVYNTGGYDDIRIIRMLEGIVDIYLADMRYSSDSMAIKYSKAAGYTENNRTLIKEMYRQVGNFQSKDDKNIRGLIIRLLILPNNISGTLDTLDFIYENIGTEACISAMSQYYPAYKAKGYPELSYRIDPEEYYSVLDKIDELGLDNGWIQPYEGEFDDAFAGENF